MRVFYKHHGWNFFGITPKLLINACAIPLLQYIKNPLGSITYLLNLGMVLHNQTKTYKESNTFT
jgi:hypothetical protein